MADNEIKVKVVAEADIEPLQEMDSLLDEIQEKTEVQVSVDDSEIEEATDKTEDLKDGLDETNDTAVSPDADTSGIDALIDIAGDILDQLEEINSTTVAPEVDTSGLEKAKEDIEETESSVGGLKTALVGLVATAEIERMATTADNINTSWNRLQLTFSGTNITMDVLKDKVSQVNAETSRGGGIIREYFNQMGVAGVTNADLLASSFEAVSGKAYQLDTSIESLESKLQTMVLTGNASTKMLKSLGLSAEDLANAIGVSVDELNDAFAELSPEQRLQAITTALGDGAAANQMYGNSYEGMKAKAEAAMAGLEGAVGEAILPSVIPALDLGTQAVKGLTQGFKSLPAPVQGAIGTVMGVAAIATTGIGMFGEFAGAIANLGDAYKVLKTVYTTLIPTQIAEGVAGNFSISWLALGVALGIALGLAFIYLYENCDWFREAVDNLAATLQWLAGVVYGEVMTNLQFMIDAFTEFTSALGLNTSDWKQAILGFILFLPMLPAKFAEMTINTIARALGFGDDFTQRMVDAASNAFNGFMDWIRQLPDAFRAELETMLTDADNFRIALPGALGVAANLMVDAWKAGSGEGSPGYMYQAFIEELSAMLGLTPEFTAQLVNAFLLGGLRMVAAWVNSSATLINNVVSFGTKFVSQLTSIAQRGVSAFSNAIQGIVTALQNCLNWAYNVVMSSPLVSALQWLGQQASYAFSVLGLGQGSPGKIVKHMKEELQWTSEAVQNSDLAKDTARLGASMADSFNPAITPLTDSGGTGIVGGDTIINIYGDVDNDDRVKQIVDAVRRELNWDNKTAGRTV